MSEQLYRLSGVPQGWPATVFDLIEDGWLVPVTRDDILNDPEMTELFWDLVYGEGDGTPTV